MRCCIGVYIRRVDEVSKSCVKTIAEEVSNMEAY